MSVDIEPVLTDNQLDWHFTLRNFPNFSLASFTAGQARTKQQEATRSPLPDNAAHGEVVGVKPQSVRKAFSSFAVWVHLISEA